MNVQGDDGRSEEQLAQRDYIPHPNCIPTVELEMASTYVPQGPNRHELTIHPILIGTIKQSSAPHQTAWVVCQVGAKDEAGADRTEVG